MLCPGEVIEDDPIQRRRVVIRVETVAHHAVGPGAPDGDRRVNVEEPVQREAGRGRDPEEAALGAGRDGDREDRGEELSIPHETNATRALGHQPIAAGKKGDPPRDLQAAHHRLGLERRHPARPVPFGDEQARRLRLAPAGSAGSAGREDQPSAAGATFTGASGGASRGSQRFSVNATIASCALPWVGCW